MKNTKHRILNTSRQLFNKLGYSQVTIRMIALELKMSSGNLNYHFQKREEILEALYFEMVEVFDKRVEELENQPLSLKFMKVNIQISMERMVQYRFFWTDLYNLLKSSIIINAHFESVKKERESGYLFLFKNFINQDILKKSSYSNEYLLLIERMVNFSNVWIYASSLYDSKIINDVTIERASFHLLSMMYPYLTSRGKREVRNLYSDFFTE